MRRTASDGIVTREEAAAGVAWRHGDAGEDGTRRHNDVAATVTVFVTAGIPSTKRPSCGREVAVMVSTQAAGADVVITRLRNGVIARTVGSAMPTVISVSDSRCAGAIMRNRITQRKKA